MPYSPACMPRFTPHTCTGLILSGGGARAAYQVGVLRAVMRLRREAGLAPGNPFPVLAGTSAGAINAAALATSADDVDGAVAQLVEVWSGFRASQVYRTDSLGVVRSGARWLTMMSMGWALARLRRQRPRSLLDNEPLHDLLQRLVNLDRLPGLIEDGHLHGLAVSTSSYTSGRHVTFYQSSAELPSRVRSNRIALRMPITHEHLLASSALPFIFPAVNVQVEEGEEWLGDGSMRQAAPISPAIHLGADRVLVIGAGRMNEPAGPRALTAAGYPSVAQIGGHALSSIFLDALAVDAERLERINATLALIPPEARAHSPLRPVELLLISPSQRLDDIAARHVESLPTWIRAMLGGLGVTGAGAGGSGAALASYLLFEEDYTRELIALGDADTVARRDDVVRFLSGGAGPGA